MLVVPEQKCKTLKQFQALNGFIFWSRLRLLKEIQGKFRMVKSSHGICLFPNFACSRARSTLLWKYVLQGGHWTFVHSAPIKGSFILDST